MKTTIITSLALIATALAAPALNERQVDKRNVKLGLNKEFLGSPPNEQVNPEVTISQCYDLATAPQPEVRPFNNKVSAISFNGDIECLLFDFEGCNGGGIGPLRGEIRDLSKINFDDKLSSLFCTFIPKTD